MQSVGKNKQTTNRLHITCCLGAPGEKYEQCARHGERVSHGMNGVSERVCGVVCVKRVIKKNILVNYKHIIVTITIVQVSKPAYESFASL